MNFRAPLFPLLTVLWLTGIAALAAAGNSERLRLHPRNPHYFLFRGKPTVLITSGEHYGAVLNLDFNYVKYLDTHVRRRVLRTVGRVQHREQHARAGAQSFHLPVGPQ